jgi:hypothetical protein
VVGGLGEFHIHLRAVPVLVGEVEVSWIRSRCVVEHTASRVRCGPRASGMSRLLQAYVQEADLGNCTGQPTTQASARASASARA